MWCLKAAKAAVMTHFPTADSPPKKGHKASGVAKASCIIVHLLIRRHRAW